ncbi:MAG: RHS repeat-associated core domain-containing protein [Oscillatoria sp. PMC 1051.18]|nr:RHS repeat-associated core domain-containing protein [Oscillatoria sp. PMC 1051.18]
MEVENQTTGEVVEYGYDGRGKRVRASDGNGVRQFLVAPAMGSGLESTDLMSDGNGNLISNFVYAGGVTPFMRLDESGNPIYYLMDGMGTVIGLADGEGQEVADFDYDSFGNLRSGDGVDDAMGGDFRFQGQWLESESGLYYFRARDYDPKNGLFLSRDPVDIIETEPESFNPYQFVYNNPHVFSDPTGMITLIELNTADSMRNILQYGRSVLTSGIRDFIEEKTSKIVGNIIMSAINQLVPGNVEADTWASLQSNISRDFENFLKDHICNAFQELGQPFSERLWIEPAVTRWNGKPQSNGLNCNNEATGRIGPNARVASHPDFIIKDGPPYSSNSGRPTFKRRNPKSYVIGDLKATTKSALKQINDNDNQWQAISKYADKYQAMPFALYVTFMRNTRREGIMTDNQLAAETMKAQENALRKNVILFLLKIRD